VTTPTNAPPGPPTEASICAALDGLRTLFCGLVHQGVADAIARRERQAEVAARRYLGTRLRSEIGVYRYQVGDGAARPLNAVALAPDIAGKAVDKAQVDGDTASTLSEAHL
jgi:hypothetical protein